MCYSCFYIYCANILCSRERNRWLVSGYVCNIICFVSLQHDDAAKQCQDLSQELVNLRGELGKLVCHDHTFFFNSSLLSIPQWPLHLTYLHVFSIAAPFLHGVFFFYNKAVIMFFCSPQSFFPSRHHFAGQ